MHYWIKRNVTVRFLNWTALKKKKKNRPLKTLKGFLDGKQVKEAVKFFGFATGSLTHQDPGTLSLCLHRLHCSSSPVRECHHTIHPLELIG